MGFELPIDVDYCDHPKVMHLVAALGKRADIFPIRLWLWCAKFSKDGVIKGGANQIEKACRWDGKPGVLHAALVGAGLIDQDGKTVHDWDEHGGRMVAAYERKKSAQRKAYKAKSSGILPEENENSSSILPEECRNSAGILPTLKEKKRKEGREQQNREGEKPPEIDDATFLATEFAFLGGEGNSPNATARARPHMAHLLSHGFTKAGLLANIRDPLRNPGEHPGRFAERLLRSRGIDNSKPAQFSGIKAWAEKEGLVNDQG